MKKLICLLCVGAMVLTGCTTKNEPTDGGKTEQELATYTGKGSGYGGELTVEVDMLGSSRISVLLNIRNHHRYSAVHYQLSKNAF